MKELIGQTVRKIFIDVDDESIAFVTDTQVIGYATDGECCSSTWIDSVTGVEALLNQTVLTHESMNNVELGKDRDTVEGHYIEVMENYGEKLTTQQGHIDIIYRNSSNGYYMGSIYLMPGEPNTTGWQEITQDWVA